MRRLWLASLALLLMVSSASADVITQWNFNSVPPDNPSNTATGTLTPNVGSGTASLLGGVTGTFASGSASGGSSDPAGVNDNSGWQTTNYAAQGTEDKLRGVQFNVSTAGWNGITLSYDLRHSNTSSRFEQVQYSLDGSNWVDAQVNDGNLGDTWFNNRIIDLTGVTGANDNANFGLRIVSTFQPGTSQFAASNATATYAPGGTWRFDMITVSGASAVPEPTSLLLLSLVGSTGLVVRIRRQTRNS